MESLHYRLSLWAGFAIRQNPLAGIEVMERVPRANMWDRYERDGQNPLAGIEVMESREEA